MFTIRHLQQQYDELQKQYDLLSTRIQRLEADYAIETDTDIEFKLGKKIEQAEGKRNIIVERIQLLEDQIEALDITTRLHKALQKLNYYNQVIVFQQLMDFSQIGAFVIHGEPRHGQNWLLELLVDRVPYTIYPEYKVVEIAIQYLKEKWDIGDLRYQLCRITGLRNSHTLINIVEQVHNWWQARTVILIIHNIDAMDVRQVQEFIQNFWLPLVEKAQKEPCPSPYHRLLMILVDNDASVDAWSINCAEQINEAWTPRVIVKPPKLTRFSRDLLTQWMKYESAVLPPKMRNVTVEEILENSMNGLPEYALEYICNVCDCKLLKRGPEWIKR